MEHNPLSVAPMMGRTDRHFRYLMRGISRRTLLYTEMVTTNAILRGGQRDILGFSPQEKPLVLQLGGSEPAKLAECARIAAELGYDQINLNIGCPSPRVGKGSFGVWLMERPKRVAECFLAMQAACNIPVSIKHRLGIGQQSSYAHLASFVTQIAQAGCRRFIVHARIAILEGLSPAQNRRVPPLRYELVYRLARDFPQLSFEINGGVRDLKTAAALLAGPEVGGKPSLLAGVMIGRAAYENPCLFSLADRHFYNAQEGPPSLRQLLGHLEAYLARWHQRQVRDTILRHALNLFGGVPGSRFWRRYLSDPAHQAKAPSKLLKEATQRIPPSFLDV